MTDLLRAGRVDQRVLAAEHLRRGSWTVRRRLLGTPAHRLPDRPHGRRRAALLDPREEPWTPADTPLAAVGSAGPAAGARERAGEELLEHTGPVRRLVGSVVEEADRATIRGQTGRGRVGLADGAPG